MPGVLLGKVVPVAGTIISFFMYLAPSKAVMTARRRGALGVRMEFFCFFCHLFVLHLCVRSSSSMNEARASLRSGGEESRGRSVAARESCTLFPSLSLKCHARMPPSARHAHPPSFTLSASSRALSRLLDLETATTIIRDMPSEAPLPAN